MILKNWLNLAANVIQNPRLIFLSISISVTVKAESNTFYKYEYECTLCVPYQTQAGFCW